MKERKYSPIRETEKENTNSSDNYSSARFEESSVPAHNTKRSHERNNQSNLSSSGKYSASESKGADKASEDAYRKQLNEIMAKR